MKKDVFPSLWKQEKFPVFQREGKTIKNPGIIAFFIVW